MYQNSIMHLFHTAWAHTLHTSQYVYVAVLYCILFHMPDCLWTCILCSWLCPSPELTPLQK